jgi:hypothetical protein
MPRARNSEGHADHDSYPARYRHQDDVFPRELRHVVEKTVENNRVHCSPSQLPGLV